MVAPALRLIMAMADQRLLSHSFETTKTHTYCDLLPGLLSGRTSRAINFLVSSGKPRRRITVPLDDSVASNFLPWRRPSYSSQGSNGADSYLVPLAGIRGRVRLWRIITAFS